MFHEPILTAQDPHGGGEGGPRPDSDWETEHRWAGAAVDLVTALRDAPGADRMGMLADCVAAASAAELTCVFVRRRVSPAGGSEAEAGTEVVVGAARGPRARQLTGLVFSSTGSLFGPAFDSGRPFLVDAPDLIRGGAPVTTDSGVETGPTLILPLAGPGRTGVFITASPPRGGAAFTAADLEAALRFGRLARAALLLDAGHAERERLAVQRDRDRIARDLHDRVIQRLFAAGLAVRAVGGMTADPALRQRLADQVLALDTVIAEIRTAVFALSEPEHTGPVSVRRSILDLVDELGPLFPRPPVLAFSGAIDLLVPAALADDLLAVLREGLTNVLRHARAGETAVNVAVTAAAVTVEISDDGVGLSGAKRRSGLASLSARAERWRGMLTLTDRRPRGTRLVWTASLPDVPDGFDR